MKSGNANVPPENVQCDRGGEFAFFEKKKFKWKKG